MSKRIRRKREKRQWIASFGAIKATCAYCYEVRNGRMMRQAVTVLHTPVDSETRDHLQYIEKIPVRIFA